MIDWCHRKLRYWFGFSRRESYSSCALLVVMLALLAGVWWQHHRQQPAPILEGAAWVEPVS